MTSQHTEREQARAAIRASVSGMLASAAPGSIIGLDDAVGRDLWSSGFAGVGRSEALGGSGGTLWDLVAVLGAIGASGVSAPAVENFALASSILGGAPTQPGDVPILSLRRDDRALRLEQSPSGPILSGTAQRVADGRSASRFVVACIEGSTSTCAIVSPDLPVVTIGENLAGEPRDTVHFDGIPVDALGVSVPIERLRTRAAIVRAAAMVGACEQVRDLTVRHASVREQFDRQLAGFQAVQHHLAEIAEEVAAAGASVDGAVGELTPAAAGSAWVRSVAAAGVVARLGHQVHGAIGTSLEYPLGRLTTRLWSWSSELGPIRDWQQAIGVALFPPGPRPDLWHALVPATRVPDQKAAT